MKPKNARSLLLISTLTLQLFTFSTLANAAKGGMDGGGGDTSEIKVDKIRSILLDWISNHGANNFILPPEITKLEYENKMREILKPKEVIFSFIENSNELNTYNRLLVEGMPKTCKGFISDTDNRKHVICLRNIFESLKEEEQFQLIHHEFAGLIGLEKNEGSASDYFITKQLIIEKKYSLSAMGNMNDLYRCYNSSLQHIYRSVFNGAYSNYYQNYADTAMLKNGLAEKSSIIAGFQLVRRIHRVIDLLKPSDYYITKQGRVLVDSDGARDLGVILYNPLNQKLNSGLLQEVKDLKECQGIYDSTL